MRISKSDYFSLVSDTNEYEVGNIPFFHYNLNVK